MRELNYNVDKDFDGKQVIQLLKHYGYSKAIITSLKHDDRLLCNGNHIRTIDILKKGDVVTIKLEDCTDIIPNESLSVPIVYNDNDVIIFNKPPFMAVHPSLKHYDDTLANYFTALYPNMAFRSVNRLDRNTSGIVVVAKNQLAAAHLAGKELFRPKKTYYAIVNGDLSERFGNCGEIIAPIARVSDSLINREVRPDGQHAHTVFKVIKKSSEMSLLEIALVTGRTHQIRVHFSSIGYPLVGDDLYGWKSKFINRQALHCGIASFIHPLTKKKIAVNAPFPEDISRLINMI